MKTELKTETILIVDDLPANIDILVQILQPQYSLRVALNGPRALEVAQQEPVDLILLDVMMPELNGFEVCSRLKADPRTSAIPVIFVSALINVEDEAFGLGLGAVDYIAKPFSPAIVQARVRSHLALANQQRHLERSIRVRTRQLEESRFEIIRRLGRAAEFSDNDTGLHVVRVSNYAYLISKAAGLAEEEARLIRDVAPLHDVGKIGVPEHILLKPGALDDDEWKMVRAHCEIGRQIIGEHGDRLLQEAALCAYSHHERWNGTGYPRGLAGVEIPMVARVVAIADVFDALTCKRPYKDAWPADAAVAEIIRGSGTHFDPFLVQAFLRALPGILTEMTQNAETVAPAPMPAGNDEITPCPTLSAAV
ncbi:HD-GYP domain-containing protein [Geomesophilobacter sediminis]|uniref:Response regulator n=1 Tax=Geomesophilobacter sediminis TaxID=2798584 RepID=A0A8J7IPJ0_9BACT|nr:HD domain-containing phosphohydrolase [Geomesophilobacter sediminis]MBJ6725493.1 response regulator [Geomesophilobacter sediminis]